MLTQLTVGGPDLGQRVDGGDGDLELALIDQPDELGEQAFPTGCSTRRLPGFPGCIRICSPGSPTIVATGPSVLVTRPGPARPALVNRECPSQLWRHNGYG